MSVRALVAVAILSVLVAVSAPAVADDGIALLPDRTQGLLTIHNLKKLYGTLGIDELRNERSDDFSFLSEELVEDVGIDLLDPAALEAAGFDLDKPIHVGILVDPPAVVALLPGSGNALDWVRAKMEGQGVHFAREEKIKGVTVNVGDADEVACFEHKGYFAIVITDQEEEHVSAFGTAESLIKGDGGASFTKSDEYRGTMKRLPQGADITFYMGPNLRAEMSSWGKSDEELAEYGLTRDDVQSWERDLGLSESASALALQIADDRLRVDGYSLLPKDSKARKWLIVDTDPVAFLRRAPGNPWLVMMSRVDFGAMWESLRPILDRARKGDDGDSFSDGFAKFKQETGVDVESEIIGQLRGNLGLLIDRVAMIQTDLMFLLQVRDPQRFQGTIDKLTALGKEELEAKARENADTGKPQAEISTVEIGGVKAYRVGIPPMAEVVYGMVDDHFVAASTQTRFGAVVSGEGSFVESLGNDVVRTALTDRGGGAFYIDFRALSRDAEGILPMFGPKGVAASQILAELSELVITSRIDDGGVVQVTTLSSTRPGIWKYLIGMLVDEVEAIPEN